jgi:hypothetical protein
MHFIITNFASLSSTGHSIAHFIGLDNLSGPYYGFWSGFGSDLAEFALLGTLFGLYRHHKCASCWRLGHHPVKGTPYETCHKHATVATHAKLHKQHEHDYPDQHKLFNADE